MATHFRQGLGRALFAALTALACAGGARAQAPATPADVEAEERLLREAKESRAAILRAADGEDARLKTALAAAKARRLESDARVEALLRAVGELRARSAEAESRSAAVAALRASIESALNRVAAALATALESDAALVAETGVPLSRRIAQAFHLSDRRDPARSAVSVKLGVLNGRPGRELSIGAVVRYFVFDAPGESPVFLPSGKPTPAAFAENVRRAARVAEKRSESVVLRLPLEPKP